MVNHKVTLIVTYYSDYTGFTMKLLHTQGTCLWLKKNDVECVSGSGFMAACGM